MSPDVKTVLNRMQDVPEFLGEALVDVNQPGTFGNYPLKVAVSWDVTTLKTLLDGGAKVNAKNEDGYTALHHAAAKGDVEMCRLLIERRADVAAQNDEGRTPLDLARSLRRSAVVVYLEGIIAGLAPR